MRWYKRKVQIWCFAILAVAILVRFWGDSPSMEQVVTTSMAWELGRVGQWEAEESPPSLESNTPAITTYVVETQPEVVEPPDQIVLSPSTVGADQISFSGTGVYDGNVADLLQRDLNLHFDREEPTILLIHAHTSESYAQAVGWEYDETDTSRTQDGDFNMIRVGDALAQILRTNGYSVIHDKTVHDYPDYNSSYSNTLTDIEYWLEKYPSITMVLDIHRDAAEGADGLPIDHTATVDGVDVAQMMLVVGTDQGGLYHPNWEGNLSFACQLQQTMLEDYPQLPRAINLRTERFNQHATPASLLIEVGSSGNTLEEALAGVELLGDSLVKLLSQYP